MVNPYIKASFKLAKEIRRQSWLATDSGRKFSLGCAIIASVGSAAYNILPHSILLDRYRELFQMYRKKAPVTVSSKIKKYLDTVLQELGISAEQQALLKPFTVNGFDLFHAGTTVLSTGAIIGVPTSFNYEGIEDIEPSNLLVQSRHVDWSQTDGKNLLSALTLSEKARKFAIAREIVRCQTIEPILNSMYPPFCILMTYGIARKMNSFMHHLPRSSFLNFIKYSLLGLFFLGNWTCLKDVTSCSFDRDCDVQVAELGEDYLKGGQEFYDKILQRNIALRNLMGKEGVKLYSATGNDEFFIRQKRLPIIQRKLYFDKAIKNFSERYQPS
ncbi:transmembrane protein 177 [Athalia rosae]|uniref:transmembrane protein 177 n=1 Tax=Athalia rosae TaxID=37344 RepID=UPI002033B791|nr:transmembrane protein 177 [Athalia rosae]